MQLSRDPAHEMITVRPPTSALTVAVERLDRTLVLVVDGDLDLLTAPELERALDHAVNELPRRLVVDLSAVPFMGSTGIAVLIQAHDRAGGHTQLRIVAAGPATLRPLQVTGVDSLLALYDSRHAALTQP